MISMSEKCEQCGNCTEVCPIAEIIDDLETFEVFTDKDFDLWNCCSCFLCEENCPNKLSVREEIFKKRQAIDLQNFPKRIRKYYNNIIETGFVFPMDEIQNLTRKKIGLKELDLEKIKSEIKKLIAKTESGAKAET